jgi:hypothetical protein
MSLRRYQASSFSGQRCAVSVADEWLLSRHVRSRILTPALKFDCVVAWAALLLSSSVGTQSQAEGNKFGDRQSSKVATTG